MTPSDAAYLEWLIGTGMLASPVLELGSREIPGQVGNGGRACRRHGLTWEGTDVEPGEGVDWLLDITARSDVAAVGRTWPTVLMLNVVEHIYDPLSAMRNALHLTAIGGHLVIVSPAVWQLHDFPADYWRPLPDTYTEFARREGCAVVDQGFRWLVGDAMLPVRDHVDGFQKVLPAKFPLGERVFGRGRYQRSRLVHRVFRTVGRELAFPYVALGVVLRRER